MNILEEIKTLIVEEKIKLKIKNITPTTKFVDSGIDSLDLVNLAMAIENKHSITIDDVTLLELKEKTVQDFIDIIEKQVAAKNK